MGETLKPKKKFKFIPTIPVCHVEGSGEKYPPRNFGYDSWKVYWEDKKKQPFPSIKHTCPCHKNNENNPDITEFVGAHVIDDNGRMYITPTCDACNKKAINDEEFRNKPFNVRKTDLVLFDPDELEKEHRKR